MGLDAKKVKAKTMYESGLYSLRDIGRALGTDSKTIHRWKIAGKWIKGKKAAKWERKEEKAFEKEAERRGLTRARVEAKTVALMEAKKTVFYEGQAIADVEDNGTQLGATTLAADLLNMRKSPEQSLLEAGVFAFYREKLKEKKGQS